MKINKKILTTALIGLSVVSIAGIGFASWVFNEETSATNDSFAVTTGKVEGSGLTATIEATDLDLKVAFENVNSGNVIPNGDGLAEDLEFSFTTKVTTNGEDIANELKGIKIDFAPQAKFLELQTQGYITFPFNKNNTVVSFDFGGTTATSTDFNSDRFTFELTKTDAQTATLKSTFTFAWGSKFNNKNPGLNEVTETLKTDLTAFVNAMEAITEKPLMNITVTPDRK